MIAKRFEKLYQVIRPRIAEPDDVRLRLQRNEKPDDWSSELLRRIFHSIPPSLLQRYPDPTGFYAKLACFLDLDVENLVLTSGIDESIRTLITLYCESGDKYAAPAPGYAMYEVYGRVLGSQFVPLGFEPERPVGAQGLMAMVPDDAKIVFFPNPGQPVENCLDIDALREIAKGCCARDTLFVIDEAYHYFGGPSALSLIGEFDNVLVMRTFSKAFGAASLRLGFIAGSPVAIKPFGAFRLAHEANALSLHVGSVLLDSFESEVMPSVRRICDGRNFLREQCVSHGFDAWGEFSNNVLIDVGDKARAHYVVKALAAKGIHVKSGFPAPLDQHILVTCGPVAMMSEFLAVFLEAASEPVPHSRAK